MCDFGWIEVLNVLVVDLNGLFIVYVMDVVDDVLVKVGVVLIGDGLIDIFYNVVGVFGVVLFEFESLDWA